MKNNILNPFKTVSKDFFTFETEARLETVQFAGESAALCDTITINNGTSAPAPTPTPAPGDSNGGVIPN